MKNKKTLQQKLSKRKYHRPSKLVWFVLAKFIMPFLSHRYNPCLKKSVDINKVNGPKFIIYNHQSRLDYIWITKLTYPERINFVIGYNEFFRSHLKFVFKLINSIPKKNFTTDIPSIRAMKSIISQGGTVCFAPEGMSSITGHNQPIVPGTGKFFKHFGVPVFLEKSKGAYLTNHKVCLDERKGRVDAELTQLFTKEDLDKLSAEEIQSKIDEALWQDDYEWNKKERIKFETHGNICSHFDDLAYHCPKCGEEFCIKAEGNKIFCEKCGNGAMLDDYYEFHPFENSIIPESLSRWCDEERRTEYLRIKNDPNYSFSEEVKLGELPKYKYLKHKKTSEICGEGIVTIDHQGFHYRGTRHNEPFNFDLDYKTFTTLVIVTDCTSTGLYYNDEYLEIFPKRKSIGKMLLMVEEFARFHYNTWPNFPWMDWIYKE